MTSALKKTIEITMEDLRLAIQISGESVVFVDREAIWIILPGQTYPSQISMMVLIDKLYAASSVQLQEAHLSQLLPPRLQPPSQPISYVKIRPSFF